MRENTAFRLIADQKYARVPWVKRPGADAAESASQVVPVAAHLSKMQLQNGSRVCLVQRDDFRVRRDAPLPAHSFDQRPQPWLKPRQRQNVFFDRGAGCKPESLPAPHFLAAQLDPFRAVECLGAGRQRTICQASQQFLSHAAPPAGFNHMQADTWASEWVTTERPRRGCRANHQSMLAAHRYDALRGIAEIGQQHSQRFSISGGRRPNRKLAAG
jgi:hypothetical protein